MQKRCPECEQYTEMLPAYVKWTRRQVYQCKECCYHYLECLKCSELAKVGEVYDDLFCEDCGQSVTAFTVLAVGIIGTIFARNNSEGRED